MMTRSSMMWTVASLLNVRQVWSVGPITISNSLWNMSATEAATLYDPSVKMMYAGRAGRDWTTRKINAGVGIWLPCVIIASGGDACVYKCGFGVGRMSDDVPSWL